MNRFNDILKKDKRWILDLTIRRLANFLVRIWFSKTKIKPNTITIFSAMVAAIAVVLFIKGTHFYLVVGSILVFISLTLDSVDGQLARYQDSTSSFGDYLDKSLDIAKEFFLILGLSIGYYCKTLDVSIFILGWIALFVMIMGHYNARLFEKNFSNKKRTQPNNFFLRNLDFGFGEKMLYITFFAALNQIKLLFIISILLGGFRMIYDPILKLKPFEK